MTIEGDLLHLMKSYNISDMYEKFHEHGITTDILWELTDEMLDDILHLNAVEKLKYDAAKKQHANIYIKCPCCEVRRAVMKL